MPAHTIYHILVFRHLSVFSLIYYFRLNNMYNDQVCDVAFYTSCNEKSKSMCQASHPLLPENVISSLFPFLLMFTQLAGASVPEPPRVVPRYKLPPPHHHFPPNQQLQDPDVVDLVFVVVAAALALQDCKRKILGRKQ